MAPKAKPAEGDTVEVVLHKIILEDISAKHWCHMLGGAGPYTSIDDIHVTDLEEQKKKYISEGGNALNRNGLSLVLHLLLASIGKSVFASLVGRDAAEKRFAHQQSA